MLSRITQCPIRSGRGAERHDLVAHEFDAGGGRSAGRVERPVASDRLVGQCRAIDLTKGDRDAQRRGRAREAHRFERVAGRRRGAARLCFRDPICGQQRAFDLHEMHVGGRLDASVANGFADSRRNGVDLMETPEMLVG
jgi:hypothetical protein